MVNPPNYAFKRTNPQGAYAEDHQAEVAPPRDVMQVLSRHVRRNWGDVAVRCWPCTHSPSVRRGSSP